MKYLESLEKFGINLGLERITALLQKLDNPQQKFKSVHIAGTNGKGSTAATLASILKEAGYKVGLYTSPHLFEYNERIKINGRNIPDKRFEEGLGIIKDIVENPILKYGELFPTIHCGVADEKQKITPTVFEALTAVAFWYFAKKKVDYAVVEVGMGGRLDATNVLTPLVSVITNIELEHTKILGNSLTKIAKEKAAIIKPGIPVVTAENKSAPLSVIKQACKKKNSSLLLVEPKSFTPEINKACALSAILLANIKVSKKAIKLGLKKVDWPGRFQVVKKRPLIMVDGAHNPAGIKALKVMIKERFGTVVFGCQKDKDYLKMLRLLRPITKQLIVTQSTHKQARRFKDSTPLKRALEQAKKQPPILITGSLFLVADALNLLDHEL